MNATVKGSLYTFLFILATEVIYQLYLKRKSKKRTSKNESESKRNRLSSSSLQVLFFPDKQVACREFFISGNGCFKDNCRFSHDKTSLSELCQSMARCKNSMDVCIYVFTCKELAETLLLLFKRGVKLRIITDQDQLNATGSQIWTLRKEGIPVRMNQSTYLMHHKFVIVDEKILINGSFNWTYAAITGNHENLIITDDSVVTSLFSQEFQRLWEKFDPLISLS
ncbi:mitochondrial cardiolipin hydrolase-like [Physella acuta]|uniref:mitochondrial cardiolipin hydrolase-like n=1 Tax=Physella acuta TaxID=109671 RepID=UPI0027DE9780|nr:mitochondrial cardiolipin hydrolase-like [Physella acuta]